ncbi:peptidylprolyl isomerase [Pseudogracilibacillus sp. SO30301A]|uniref:peptidylprolyl isomerase n=1 Tax=Pseudogracilibacillus sp. SO30301A TaxID=3098291 RepID=UPI00300DF47C
MKKVYVSMFLFVSILSACHSSILSFSKIENVPSNVQNIVNSNLRLQLINDGDKGSYIIFQSSGEVEADLETQGDTITIKFNVLNPQNDVLMQNTYYLTKDKEHDVIDVLMNGESIPFDEVTNLNGD